MEPKEIMSSGLIRDTYHKEIKEKTDKLLEPIMIKIHEAASKGKTYTIYESNEFISSKHSDVVAALEKLGYDVKTYNHMSNEICIIW